MQRVQSRSRVEQVAESLEAEIASGRWPVGGRIPPEPALLEMLGVARNTMREAVRALAYAGVLEIRQGDGVYVRARSDMEGLLRRRAALTDLEDMLSARRALEVEAARLAARRRTADDLAALRRLVEAGGAAGVEFHTAVVEASHNPLLIEMYRALATVLAASIESCAEHPELPRLPHNAHDDLYRAVVAGDADAAAAAAAAQLDRVLDTIRTDSAPDR